MAFPDSWSSYFLISITKASGSEYQIAAIVDPESLEINEGDFPGESMVNGAGGRVWKDTQQEDGELTFDLIGVREIPIEANGGLVQYFNGGDVDSSEPLATDLTWAASVSRTRDRFRIAVLFTNDPAATTAAGATAASTDSYRFFADNCRFISHKVSMGDGTPKITVTFKFPAINRAGTTNNAGWQSGDNTALAALGSFT